MCDQPEPNLRLILVHLYGVIDYNSFSLWSPNANRILLHPDTQGPSQVLGRMMKKQKPNICAWRPEGGEASPAPCMSCSCSRLCTLPWTRTLREAGCLPFSGECSLRSPSSPGTRRPSPLARGSQIHHLLILSSFPSWPLPLLLPGSLFEMILDKYHSFQHRQCKITTIKSTESNTWTCTVSTEGQVTGHKGF